MANFDNLGLHDLLWRHADGGVSIWLSSSASASTFNAQSYWLGVIALDWNIAAIGDYSLDGKDDILWRNDNGALSLWTMDGATIAQNQFIGDLSLDWKVVGTADFKGVGSDRILLRHDNGAFAMWTMEGATILQSNFITDLSNDWQLAGIGDLTGDGKDDIVLRHVDGGIALWEMDGAQIVSSQWIGSLGSDYRLLAVGNFVGTNTPGVSQRDDLAWMHESGVLTFWEMDGAVVVKDHTFYDTGLPDDLMDFDTDVVAVGQYHRQNWENFDYEELLISSPGAGASSAWLGQTYRPFPSSPEAYQNIGPLLGEVVGEWTLYG